jgi:hypothetical protein
LFCADVTLGHIGVSMTGYRIHPVPPIVFCADLWATQIISGQVNSGQIKSTQVKSSLINSNQLKSGQVKTCQVRLGQFNSNQISSNQINSNQVRSDQDRVPHPSSSSHCVLCGCVGNSGHLRSGQLRSN